MVRYPRPDESLWEQVSFRGKMLFANWKECKKYMLIFWAWHQSSHKTAELAQRYAYHGQKRPVGRIYLLVLRFEGISCIHYSILELQKCRLEVDNAVQIYKKASASLSLSLSLSIHLWEIGEYFCHISNDFRKKEFLLFRESAMGMDLVRYASDYLCFKIADRCIDALRYFRMASPQYLREPFKKFLF